MTLIDADALLKQLREQRKQMRADLAEAKEKGWLSQGNNLQARLQEMNIIMKEVREMKLKEDSRQLDKVEGERV